MDEIVRLYKTAKSEQTKIAKLEEIKIIRIGLESYINEDIDKLIYLKTTCKENINNNDLVLGFSLIAIIFSFLGKMLTDTPSSAFSFYLMIVTLAIYTIYRQVNSRMYLQALEIIEYLENNKIIRISNVNTP